MIFKEEHRDLFSVNTETTEVPYCLAHCISADFGMFGGIVVEFNRRWDMKNRLLQKYGSQVEQFRMAEAAVFPEEVHHNGVLTTVFNLVTKPTVADRPTYRSLKAAISLMREYMVSLNLTKLAIPLLGCGIDGLEWDKVKDIIQTEFEDTNIEILVCRR